MEQINLTFQSNNIDSRNHILSVLILTDSFVYGVFDKNHNLVVADIIGLDRDSGIPIAEIAEDSILNSTFYKTIVTYSTKEFVHLNDTDFEGGDFELYFSNRGTNTELLQDAFTDSDIHVVFPVKSNTRAWLHDLLDISSEIHISTAMRQFIYPSKADTILVLVEPNRLHFMKYVADKLEFYNAYSFSTKEDFLYYMQLSIQQSGVDANKDNIKIGGLIEKSSELYKFTEPYYRHLKLMTLPLMNVTSTDSTHMKHYYSALYFSVLCVS